MEPVVLEDQTLRDGLQIESRIFTLEEKIQLVDMLTAAGVNRIQLGSFVHPERVPQMADTDALVKRLSDREGIIFTGLVLNDKGLDRASDCGLTHVAISCSVSDAHSRRNVNRPAAEALESVAGLAGAAVSAGMTVRAGLQCAFGCVYEGAIPPARVLAAAETMAAAGVHEINLADTTGMANPATIRALCGEVTRRFPDLPVILHLHDTRALGVSNMLAGYESGVRIFDVCAGGLGGCPFVKGAAGNVPTEDGVYLFESMGVPTGISLAGIAEVVEHLETVLERPLPGRLARVVRASRELSLVPPLSE